MQNQSFEIWIDTLDKDIILHAKELGLLYGVTTNPTILSRYEQSPLKSIETILDLFEGPLAVQVTAAGTSQMLSQATALYKLSSRIIVKIPCVQEGYKTMYALAEEGKPVLATAIYTVRQYQLASFYGAKYAAPYYSRISKLLKDESNLDVESANSKAKEIVSTMLSLAQNNDTKVMLAAIDSPLQVDELVPLNLRVATLTADVYKKWIADYPKVLLDLKQFSEDWHKLGSENWLDEVS